MNSNAPLTNNDLDLKGIKNFIAITAMRLKAIVIPKETAYPLNSILIHRMHNVAPNVLAIIAESSGT